MASGQVSVPENGLDNGKEMRILLVGKTGVGKSAVGNSILGQKLFETAVGSRTVVKPSEAKSSTRFGRKLVVVDTPGFFDTDKNTAETARELSKILGLVQPGFHAMVYVMGPEKFSDECIETRDVFLKVFGDAVANFTLIVVTHLDLLHQESFDPDDYLSLTTRECRDFQKRCGHRVLFFDNKADEETMENQIQDLFERIDKIDSAAKASYFTSYYLQLASAYCKLYDKREDMNINKAKRELLRRASRTLGLEQPIYWDYVKQVPVRKPKLELPKDVSIVRKASHPEIRPFGPIKYGHTLTPEPKGIYTRRYSVGADVSKMTLETPKSSESKESDLNIIEVVDEDISEFNEDILAIFDDVDRSDVEFNTGTPLDHDKYGKRITDKDFYDYFINFFSFFLASIANVKRSHRR